jgi:hypothetical protein
MPWKALGLAGQMPLGMFIARSGGRETALGDPFCRTAGHRVHGDSSHFGEYTHRIPHSQGSGGTLTRLQSLVGRARFPAKTFARFAAS